MECVCVCVFKGMDRIRRMLSFLWLWVGIRSKLGLNV